MDGSQCWIVQCRHERSGSCGPDTVGVLNRAGPTNVAAALRHHARDPHRPLATLGISLG